MISNRAGRVGGFILAVLMLAASAVTGSALTPNGPHPDQSPQREVLLNGLPVVTQTLPGDRVAVAVAVRAGAMFDPADKGGLASLTGRMLAAGGGSYTAERIRAEIEEAGATLGIVTDWDATWITAEAPSAGLATLLDVISLMVTAPRFEAAEFELARKEYLQRANARAVDADAVADLELSRALYGRHTYGRSPEGDPATIAAITLGDVKAFWDKFYVANAGALAVAGPAQQAEVMRLAKPRFGRWRMGKIVPATFLAPAAPAAPKVVVVDAPALKEARVRVGFVGPRRIDAAAQAVRALQTSTRTVLSRSGGQLGPLDVTYAPRVLASPFVIAASAPAGTTAVALRFIVDEIGKLASGATPPPPPPMTGAPRAPDAAAVARSAAATAFYAGQGLADTRPAPLGSTAITDAAREIFRPAAMAAVVVGPAAEIEPALKQAGYAVEVLRRP